MEIKVNSINEYSFAPDISNNLDFEDEKQFKIIVKKVNSGLTLGRWAKLNKKGDVEVDLKEKIKGQIVRLENAPTLVIDGKEKKKLTPELLMSEYSELFDVQNQLIDFINKLENEGNLEKKKS